MRAFLRGIWTIGVVLLMLLFGLITCLFGYLVLDEWRSFQTALLTCGVIWLISGVAMLMSAVWVARTWGGSRSASLMGASATVASGALLAAAAVTHVLPCSGPD